MHLLIAFTTNSSPQTPLIAYSLTILLTKQPYLVIDHRRPLCALPVVPNQAILEGLCLLGLGLGLLIMISPARRVGLLPGLPLRVRESNLFEAKRALPARLYGTAGQGSSIIYVSLVGKARVSC